ncbi:MAG: RNA polymerase sigma factor (TIGR02999 family) [Planctomycetota bacterium]|jgi:RNA polymerase sigma factor (TIGR02999 family)
MPDITRYLESLADGDEGAAEHLLELVYAELRELAARQMAGEAVGQTLQPTALVHEAWMRLNVGEPRDWKSRRYFFGACAEAMRRILVDRARRRGRRKHGGDLRRVDFVEAAGADQPEAIDLIALDEALEKLTSEDPGKAELVRLRFFAGLTLDEAAKTLEISQATADRHWAYAKAFLYHEMGGTSES